MRRLENRLRQLECNSQIEWAILDVERPTEASLLNAVNARKLILLDVCSDPDVDRQFFEKVDQVLTEHGVNSTDLLTRLR